MGGLLFGGPTPQDGLSAYEIAVNNGFVGTEAQWLESLIGDPGLSAYQLAQSQGFGGTLAQWLSSLVGPPGVQGPPGPSGSANVGILVAYNFGMGTAAATGISDAAGGYIKVNNLVVVNAKVSTSASTGTLKLPFKALYGVYGIPFTVGSAGGGGTAVVQPNSDVVTFFISASTFDRIFSFCYLTNL